MMPKWFHDFWLCDLNPAGIEALKALQTEHATSTRRVTMEHSRPIGFRPLVCALPRLIASDF
jgi:hypothetical protein